MALLIGCNFTESALFRGHLFSATKAQNNQILCIVNASSNLLTASSAGECVLNHKDASDLNVINYGPDGSSVSCEIYSGSDPPLFALKEGCRAFQVCYSSFYVRHQS